MRAWILLLRLQPLRNMRTLRKGIQSPVASV